jgi:hypothetical protein
VSEREERQAQELASLTGWRLADIRKTMNLGARTVPAASPRWERIWKN